MNSMSLKAKVLALCLTMALMTAMVGGVSYWISNKVDRTYHHVTDTNLPNVLALATMRSSFKDVRLGLRGLGLAGAPDDVRQKQHETIKTAIAEYDQAEKEYWEAAFVEGEKELAEPLREDWDEYHPLVDKIASLAKAGTPEAQSQFILMMVKEERDIANRMAEHLTKLMKFQREQASTWSAIAIAESRKGSLMTLGLTLIAFFIAMTLGFFFASRLTNQLLAIAAQLDQGSLEVTSAARQISDAGSELSASATEQAAALQETVSSVDEVSAMVSKNAENAGNSLKVANGSNASVQRGKQVVSEMLTSIEEINNSNTDIMHQSESSNQEIASIVKIISEIGNKTKVINDIVFQTKLLSFNASVEAARAGEHGKGFAVVAEEVGSLAQMSGNAAKEISQLLEESVQKVESTVNDTRTKIERLIGRSKERIDSGLSTARRCGEVFDEIVSGVSHVSSMTAEIASASREQAQGVQEINKAMGQMDQVTQQNAAAAQETATATEQLSKQAIVLRNMVEALMRTVEGSKASEGINHTPAAPARAESKISKPRAQVVSITKKTGKPYGASTIRSSRSSMGVSKKAVGSEDVPAENDPRFEEA